MILRPCFPTILNQIFRLALLSGVYSPLTNIFLYFLSQKASSYLWDLARISIGEGTNIQDLCMCHADEDIPLTVGNGVTIGHNCCIHGCTIEGGCLIGMGAVVMNKAVIGKGSVVAVGAIVLEKTVIPPYSLVTGSPGKVRKTYEDREKIDRMLKKASEHYMGSARAYGDNTVFYAVTPGH